MPNRPRKSKVARREHEGKTPIFACLKARPDGGLRPFQHPGRQRQKACGEINPGAPQGNDYKQGGPPVHRPHH